MVVGTDVIGFFTAESGIGEAARLLVRAMRSVDYPVSTINVVTTSARNENQFVVDNEWKYHHLIVSLNSFETPMALANTRPPGLNSRRVIGQWFWEVEYFPPSMHIGYQCVDEVWAPTKFITDAVRRYAPSRVEVNTMPLPLIAPQVDPEVSKIDIGVDLDRFMFLFTFSFYSVFGRKNPLAVVSAFKQAFKDGEGPILVIKSINGDIFREQLKVLKASAEGRSDIKFIDNHLHADKLGSLLNIADCYVSLHRSEGLGLTISESMALGKPVIATNYAGNVDFMTDDTSILIPWEYTGVGKGCEPYPETGKWAEPDVNAAAEAMKYVYNNQKEAKLMGQRAKNHLETHFSFEATGKKMAERLNSINT